MNLLEFVGVLLATLGVIALGISMILDSQGGPYSYGHTLRESAILFIAAGVGIILLGQYQQAEAAIVTLLNGGLR